MKFSELRGTKVDAWLWTPIEEIESAALEQLRKVASLPWAFHHVAVMPDVHWGMGATVGSVVAMKGAVAPAAVGVDIGCGMGALRFPSLQAADLPDNLRDIRAGIEAAIPVGFSAHDEVIRDAMRDPLWAEFRNLNDRARDLESRACLQCGTLGGGNHFIELCLDEHQGVWLMLHSGSRNIGKVLAEMHIKTAKQLAHNATLPDRDLAVFLASTPEFAAYRHDLFWAQRYALLNRQTMMRLVLQALRDFFPADKLRHETPILCHHNYVSEETHFGEDVLITRKGAISAKAGEMGIIPGSMGTRSYIVRGLGNPASFCSASHGAGRRMSRGAAKKTFTPADLANQTEGVECRKDAGVLDEIPGAYKDIDQVIAYQNDLVEVVATLKQVLCVKG